METEHGKSRQSKIGESPTRLEGMETLDAQFVALVLDESPTRLEGMETLASGRGDVYKLMVSDPP